MLLFGDAFLPAFADLVGALVGVAASQLAKERLAAEIRAARRFVVAPAVAGWRVDAGVAHAAPGSKVRYTE